jgi:hypothetical protein
MRKRRKGNTAVKEKAFCASVTRSVGVGMHTGRRLLLCLVRNNTNNTLNYYTLGNH